MHRNLIFISGGTGVGTSRLSLELAKYSGITNIVSTDSIREIIRTLIHSDLNPALNKSTYLAGKTKNYECKDPSIKKAEIIRAYKMQCSAVELGVKGLLERAIKENISIIIEGVHLIPGKIREFELYESSKEKILECLVYLDSEEVHKKRFNERQKDAPERPLNKYLDNFTEIRWIHDYMLDRAKRYSNINLINNSRDLKFSLDLMLEKFECRNI